MSQTVIEIRYNQAIESARSSYNQGQLQQAIRHYEYAREIIPANAAYIDARIAHINRRIEAARVAGIQIERDFQNAIASAQQYTEAGLYARALHYYHRALEIRPENAAHINARIEYINHRIQVEDNRRREEYERMRAEAVEAERVRQYQEAIISAQRNFEQRLFEQARQNYRRALELNPPSATYITPRLVELDELIVEQQRQRAEEQRRIERRARNNRILGGVAIAAAVVLLLIFGGDLGDLGE